MPRVLEDMFWFGRYAERVEDLLRLVLAAHALAEDFQARPRSTGGASLAVLMEAVRRVAGPSPAAADDLDADFRSLLLDGGRVGGVAYGRAGWDGVVALAGCVLLVALALSAVLARRSG